MTQKSNQNNKHNKNITKWCIHDSYCGLKAALLPNISVRRLRGRSMAASRGDKGQEKQGGPECWHTVVGLMALITDPPRGAYHDALLMTASDGRGMELIVGDRADDFVQYWLEEINGSWKSLTWDHGGCLAKHPE